MKYNALEKQTDTEVLHAQVIYLVKVLHKTYEEVADITGYAIGTVKNYVKKFADLLDKAKELFEEIAITHSKTKYDEVIDNNGFDIWTKQGEICYLFEFYDINHNLVCSKVGTTTRTIRQRLIEELRSKTYKDMGAHFAKVNRLYNCGNLPAEGLESLIRSEYIKKYPKSFQKNDRFIKQLFDFDKCDEIVRDYLK